MKDNFTQIPNNFIRDTSLTAMEKIVFIYILSRSGGTGVCFPSYKLMALECNACVNTVRNAARSLERIGLIEIEKRCDELGGNSSNLFIVDEDYESYF